MGVESAPSRMRSNVSFSQPVDERDMRVDREGGVFGKGLIEGVSLITLGEALGHDVWCDEFFLSEVAEAVNASATGIKARFTHPGLSSDGVGTKLGKFFNARIEGEQVLADLHFQEAAYKTPDGNLAEYVMSLAVDTPEDFGLSIVFSQDLEATDDHMSMFTTRGTFTSPDGRNIENYPHARLDALWSCDAVDSPAANPNGLFKRGQETAIEADALLEYVMGFSEEKPEQSAFNVDGDRAKQFLARFLTRHNVTIQRGSDPVTEVVSTEVETPGLSRADFNAELGRYVSAFGSVDGTAWFMEGIEFGVAQAKCIASLSSQVSSLQGELAEAQQALAAVDVGETEGVEFSAAEIVAPEKRTFSSKIRISGKSYK